MNYRARLSSLAEKHLARIDRRYTQRILQRITDLCEDPYAPRLSLPLTNRPGVRRSRLGEYRIVFEVLPDEGVLLIVRIAPRGEAYE